MFWCGSSHLVTDEWGIRGKANRIWKESLPSSLQNRKGVKEKKNLYLIKLFGNSSFLVIFMVCCCLFQGPNREASNKHYLSMACFQYPSLYVSGITPSKSRFFMRTARMRKCDSENHSAFWCTVIWIGINYRLESDRMIG